MCSKFYGLLICLGRFLQPFLLLAIRLFWGYLFFRAGTGKLTSIEATATFFDSLHIPFPHFNAYFVGIVETVGGIMLALGLGTRLAAIPLIITMAFAYATAHHESLKTILDNPELVTKEPPFNYLLASLLLFAFGPGAFSLDAIGKKLWGRKCCGESCQVEQPSKKDV